MESVLLKAARPCAPGGGLLPELPTSAPLLGAVPHSEHFIQTLSGAPCSQFPGLCTSCGIVDVTHSLSYRAVTMPTPA